MTFSEYIIGFHFLGTWLFLPILFMCLYIGILTLIATKTPKRWLGGLAPTLYVWLWVVLGLYPCAVAAKYLSKLLGFEWPI
jgi:hypothetical protein